MGRRGLFVVAAAAAVGAGCVPFASGESNASQLRFRLIARGLTDPLYVAQPRSEPNRLYVVERIGRIRVLVNGRVTSTFLDIRSLVGSAGSEQGLLSVAFHPNYARNHKLYVDYTDRNGDTRVVEFRSSGSRVRVGTRRQLLFVRQPYANHNGGQLQFGPDRLLYVGMGDGGSGGDPENRAQNLGVRLGKLLRINVDRRGASWQTAGYGLRNPWRFSWDRRTRALYIGDVGQNAWEEIDYRPWAKQRTLANYGWSVYEGRARFSRRGVNPRGELVFPVAVYPNPDQGCSVTGGYVYRGSAVPAARGRYFYGDFCSGTIWSLRVSGGRASVRRERLNVSSLSSFGEDARGELYAVSLEGRIYKLAR